MLTLSEEDREIQDRARSFVDDELIPHEVEAELGGGVLPDEVVARHQKLARELGLTAINIPKALGGGGLTMFQQVMVQEQIGRVTNGLGWVVTTPAAWLPEVATDHQMDTWVLPTIRGDRVECYAITEEGAGSDVDAIEATARRDGDWYMLSGEKWHVTSANLADHVFFQAKLEGGAHGGAHALFFVDMDTPGVRTVRTPLYSHTYAHHHPIIAFDVLENRKIVHGKVSMAKLYASEMAGRVADRAVQIFGGRGYMRENVAERFYRELRVDRIWEGTSEIQRVVIGGEIRKRGPGLYTGWPGE